MDLGIDFLKSQINNAVMQHQTFVKNLADHEKQTDDARYRALCARFLPKAEAHQRMLEDYQRELGAETGTAKKALGKALGVARDLADAARESDFLRLVGDIVESREWTPLIDLGSIAVAIVGSFVAVTDVRGEAEAFEGGLLRRRHRQSA